MSASDTPPPSDAPEHDGSDLHLLREAIDQLQDVPAQEMVSPTPETLLENEPDPQPTDPIGGPSPRGETSDAGDADQES